MHINWFVVSNGGWLGGWVVGWFVGVLVGWLDGWMVGSVVGLGGWLVGSVGGWLVGWLVPPPHAFMQVDLHLGRRSEPAQGLPVQAATARSRGAFGWPVG